MAMIDLAGLDPFTILFEQRSGVSSVKGTFLTWAVHFDMGCAL